MTSCADVDGVLEDLALGTLTGELARAVREHLASCPLHAQARELIVAGAALGFEPEPVAPPPELRRRILTSAASSAAGARPARWRFRALGAAAAVLLLVGVSIGAWQAWGSRDDGVSLARATDPASRVTLELHRSGKHTTVIVSELRPPPSGQAYQLWVIQADVWIPVTTFVPDARGRWAGPIALPLAPGDRLCVTLESASGSAWPTTPPLVVAAVGR